MLDRAVIIRFAAIMFAAGFFASLPTACFTTPKFDPCPGKLTCPNGVCCPSGFPFACNGKCYAAPSSCGSSYVTCSGPGPSSTGCPAGQTLCDDVCVSSSLVCCHHGNGAVCPAGDTCGTSSAAPCFKGSSSSGGGSAGSGSSSSSSSSSNPSGNPGSNSSSSSGSPGVPCTQSTHPAWMQGECASVAVCNCKLSSCVRFANGGCCQGYDLGWIFIPCDGSGGTSCGDCTSAAASALSQCGCPHP